MEKIRHIERYTERQVQGLGARHHLSGRLGQGGGRGAPRLARGAGRGRGALGLFDHRHLRPAGGQGTRRDTRAARALGDPPAPGRQGPAHQHGPRRRDRQRARGASLRAAGRLRRRGGPPLPRARDDPRPAPHRQGRGDQGDQELRQGDRQGPEEGDVQDGHLDLHVVHRLADLRGGGSREIADRALLHRHRHQHRGHRAVRGRRGGDPHPPGRVRRERSRAEGDARRGRRVRLARARRGPHLEPRRRRQAAAVDARQLLRDLQGIRAARQRAVAPPHDVPRALRVPLRRLQAGADRGGRAGSRDRQALLHRRDVARLDLDRGAHHARRSP